MRRLSEAIIWLKRIGQGRGFGVQSPNDYRFLKDVIKQKNPYYKYDELKQSVECHDSKSRKLCQLYFRLANDVQADYLLDINTMADGVIEYVEAACKKTKTIRITSPESRMPGECRGKVLLVRCSYAQGTDELLEQVVKNCDAKSIVVVEGIYDNNMARQLWNHFVENENVSVTYDLRHCGILVMEKRRYKNNYFVNF